MDDKIPVRLKVGSVNTPFSDYVFNLRSEKKLSRFLTILLQAYYYDEGVQVLVDKYMSNNIKMDMSSVQLEDKPKENQEGVAQPTEADLASLVKLGELGSIVDSLKDLLDPVTHFSTALKAMRETTNELGSIRDDLGVLSLERLPEILDQKDNTSDILKSYLDKEMELRMQMMSQPAMMPMYQPQYVPVQHMVYQPTGVEEGVQQPVKVDEAQEQQRAIQEHNERARHLAQEQQAMQAQHVQQPVPIVPSVPTVETPSTPEPVASVQPVPQPTVQQPVPQPVVQQPTPQPEPPSKPAVDPMALFAKSMSSVPEN